MIILNNIATYEVFNTPYFYAAANEIFRNAFVSLDLLVLLCQDKRT